MRVHGRTSVSAWPACVSSESVDEYVSVREYVWEFMAGLVLVPDRHVLVLNPFMNEYVSAHKYLWELMAECVLVTDRHRPGEDVSLSSSNGDRQIWGKYLFGQLKN